MVAATAAALDLGEQDAGPRRADAAALRGAPGLGGRILGSVSGLGKQAPSHRPPTAVETGPVGLRDLWSQFALTLSARSCFGYPGPKRVLRKLGVKKGGLVSPAHTSPTQQTLG